MSLAHARLPSGEPVVLPGEGPPFAASALSALQGVPFVLPAGDRWVHGTGDADHAYLDGARAAWEAYPEMMDAEDPASPVHVLKAVERDVYLHHWGPWLQAPRVLDVGAGVGRFTLPWLAQGATVHAVDPDHRSLQRLVWHAAGRAGHLDVHWTHVHALPEVTVDLVIAAEVLCYVPDLAGALAAVRSRLAPGGHLLISVEARYGWALSADAPDHMLHVALQEEGEGDGVVHVPGEGWVRTFTRHGLRTALTEAGFELVEVVPTHYVLDGPLEQVAPPLMTVADALAWDRTAAAHPVWSPLNRLWTAVARRP